MKLTVVINIFFITTSLFLGNHRACAQTNEYISDSTAIFDLIDKAEYYYEASNYDSAIFYVTNAIQLGQNMKYLHGEGWALIKYTDILIDKADYKTADGNPLREENIGSVLNDSLIIAISYLHSAQLKMYNEKPDEAIPLFQKALKTRLAKINSPYSALAYNDLGFTYGQKAEYQLEIENLLKALNIYEKIKDDAGAAMSLSNIAGMYYSLGDKQKAIEYQKKSLEKRKSSDVEGLAIGYCNICQMYLQAGDLTEAERYQQLCLKYSNQSKFTSRVVMGFITSGLLANAKGDNKEAFDLEKKAISTLEKSHSDSVMLATRYISAAILANNLKEDSLLTLGYFQKAMTLSKELNIRENLKSIYYYQTIFFKDRKDFYHAYENYKKYVVYRDSLNSEETKRNIAELETKYQTEKKDNEIVKLNADQKIKQLEIEKQKAIIAGDLLQAQKKQNEIDLLGKSKELLDIKIKQQDEQLEKNLLIAKNNEQQLQLAEQDKKLREKKIEEQKQLRNIMISGIIILSILGFVLFNRYQLKRKLQQQKALLDVRNNIARDLHDEIGSTLTSIKILSEVSKNNLQKDQQKATALLQKITEQSSAMQQSMSDIVWAIKPENDKLENMVIRMREYISHTLEPKNIRTLFTIDEKVLDKSINMEQRRDFFLIFKEAINNVAKYSECGQVKIDLNSDNGNIKMTITDDGVGFDTQRITSSNGLKNMQSRANALKGYCSIHSIVGKGTTVMVEVPAT
ncbi:MAG: tetratricopeptide repeat protein [Bacteroidetes bacterium]|nr:tetratricopeptide repeat protein [Bacteroidota bacterium]MBS1631100.1 tetratricopeptide repeat protein [Bacteroidota bacterium]